jgi:hypothetical protein
VISVEAREARLGELARQCLLGGGVSDHHRYMSGSGRSVTPRESKNRRRGFFI